MKKVIVFILFFVLLALSIVVLFSVSENHYRIISYKPSIEQIKQMSMEEIGTINAKYAGDIIFELSRELK